MTATKLIIDKLTEMRKKAAYDPYSPRNKLIIIISNEVFLKLGPEPAISPALTTFEPTDDMRYTFSGIPICNADRSDMTDDVNIMTEKDFNALRLKRTMYHRLITNGEWLAQGKSGKARHKVLREEAEGFAEMCAGFDHWEILVKQYIQDHPVVPATEIGLPYYDSDLRGNRI